MTTKAKKSAYQRTDTTAKIVVLSAINPCRSGTAVHRRVSAVLRSNGKTVRDALRAGARTSTVRWAARQKLVRVVPAKRAA